MFNRKGNAFWFFLALFALPLHSSESDNGGEGCNCSSSKDCNVGLVCSHNGICATQVTEEIVVTAKRSSLRRIVVVVAPPVSYPFPSSQLFPGGIDIPAQSIVFTENSIDCWTDLTSGVGSRTGWFNEPRGSKTHTRAWILAQKPVHKVYAGRSGWVVEATPLWKIVGPSEMGTYGNAANGNSASVFSRELYTVLPKANG